MFESSPGHQVVENPRLRGFFACMPAAFRAAGRLPAAGFGANFKTSHMIRGRRALSPSSPSALEFVMATPESPRPPYALPRMDYAPLEAPTQSPTHPRATTTPPR